MVPALATARADEVPAVRPAVRRRTAAAAPRLVAAGAAGRLADRRRLLAGDPRLMPGPGPVMARLWQDALTGELPFHLGMTLARVAASFVIAMTLGCAASAT